VFLRSELLWFSQTLHHVARELDQIDDDARRRGIYPGAMRDLKRQYGLEP